MDLLVASLKTRKRVLMADHGGILKQVGLENNVDHINNTHTALCKEL
jgi:hypothetical protein